MNLLNVSNNSHNDEQIKTSQTIHELMNLITFEWFTRWMNKSNHFNHSRMNEHVNVWMIHALNEQIKSFQSFTNEWICWNISNNSRVEWTYRCLWTIHATTNQTTQFKNKIMTRPTPRGSLVWYSGCQDIPNLCSHNCSIVLWYIDRDFTLHDDKTSCAQEYRPSFETKFQTDLLKEYSNSLSFNET